MNIPAQYGGTGQEQRAWALCDAPLTVYALVKFGLGNRAAVKAAVDYLAGLLRDNGWPCAVSKELGKFRGPGRKDDPCPFANLAMLKALSEIDEWRDAPASMGAEKLCSACGREPSGTRTCFSWGPTSASSRCRSCGTTCRTCWMS
jgi:hypothetical protein